jgi:hypothetical protein
MFEESISFATPPMRAQLESFDARYAVLSLISLYRVLIFMVKI